MSPITVGQRNDSNMETIEKISSDLFRKVDPSIMLFSIWFRIAQAVRHLVCVSNYKFNSLSNDKIEELSILNALTLSQTSPGFYVSEVQVF